MSKAKGQVGMPNHISEFAGLWQLTKEIADARGPEAHFLGVARITQEAAAHWRYAEEGSLRFGEGPELTAERFYLWHPAEGGVDIAYDDGRPFHRMAFGGGLAVHDCAPDRYEVTYEFDGWPLFWGAAWRVTGPRKDYVMTCRYQR